MGETATTRSPVLSHKDYLDTLQRPSSAEVQRISDVQQRKEDEIDRKYHTEKEQDAATTIQKAYRGHRDRRSLCGMTLDPSSRWIEIIKEFRFRSAMAPRYRQPLSDSESRAHSPSDVAKMNWKRIGHIAEHAGAGDRSPPRLGPTSSNDTASIRSLESASTSSTTLLDLRYFLEMVDVKHRYGSNLLVYHEEWLRSDSHQSFFDWLDRGEGSYLDLLGCKREKLDKERIRYLTKDERKDYVVRVDDQGRLRWAKTNELITTSSEQFKDSMHGIVPQDADAPVFNDEKSKERNAEEGRFARKLASLRDKITDLTDDTFDAVDESDSDANWDMEENRAVAQIATNERKPRKRFYASPATILNRLLRSSVKPGTWIYVADTVGRLYVGIKSSGAFQHASFLAGSRISSAGLIGIDNGRLTYLSPLSGHYRPTTESFRIFINYLKDQGVDLSHVKVSPAYKILLGMEYYGKAKKSLKKIVHHKAPDTSRSRSRCKDNDSGISSNSSTDQVRKDSKIEHNNGLAQPKDNMPLPRRSLERKGENG